MALDESVHSPTNNVAKSVVDFSKNPESEQFGIAHDLSVGDKIKLYWPLGYYHPGSVSEYSENTGTYLVAYNGGKIENLNMQDET